jgi:hypothetical protein
VKHCPLCGGPHSRTHPYCGDCFAAYMREWRKTVRLTGEARRRAICRAYTNVLIRRGVIQRGPCAVCKTRPSQAHHPDYGNPRLVIWLCKDHHRAEHWRLRHAPEFALGNEP